MPQRKSSEKSTVIPPAADPRGHSNLTLYVLLLGLVTVAGPVLGFLLTLDFHDRQIWGIYIRDAFRRLVKTKMRSILLTAFCFSASCFAQLASVDTFLTKQVPISKAGVLANIGPSGAKASGAKVSRSADMVEPVR